MGFGAWLLWRLRDRFRVGMLFALFLLCAGAERFLVEFVRRNSEVALGLTAAQLESLAMIVAGAIWLYVVTQRHGSLSREAAPQAGRVARALLILHELFRTNEGRRCWTQWRPVGKAA